MSIMCVKCGNKAQRNYVSKSSNPYCKSCYYAELAGFYIDHLEKRRDRDESLNPKAYQQARELSAWLSVYNYGNNNVAKRQAANYICSWMHNT